MAARSALQAFQDWITSEYRSQGTFEGVQVSTGAEAGSADLAVRLLVSNRSYYEVRVDLDRKGLEAGFATEVRSLNESIEQMILDNGGDLDDLLADELSELGEEPLHMDHYFERPAFRYAVRLPIERGEELEDRDLRRRIKAILQASRVLFQGSVDEG
jgi:hypothetical protein